jgi:hypothetical protein
MDCRSDVSRLIQGVCGNSKFPKDQTQKGKALFKREYEVQEVNLFLVRKLKRENRSRDPYIMARRK